MTNNIKNRKWYIIGALLLIVVLLGICLYACKSGGAGSDDQDSEGTLQQLEDSGFGSDENAVPDATVFFASDYQIEDGWNTPYENLKGILKAVNDDGNTVNEVVICGDYTNDRKRHDYQLSPEDNIKDIKGLAGEMCPEVKAEDMIFVQGNHDRLTESISESGLHEFDNYLVYVLNTQNDFPWRQGTKSGPIKKIRRSSKEMKECFDGLIKKGETRPVFIAGHVPLHFTARTSTRHNTGDNLYSALIFDVVNEAGKSLDIVYFVGHNHSKGWDCYLGGSSIYKAKGETLLIPEFTNTKSKTDNFTEEKLNFTYLNAGYLGYYSNYGPGKSGSTKSDKTVDHTLTGTICEIYPDALVLSRYAADGIHPIRWDGASDPYKGGIDEGLIDPAYYSKKLDSPQTIDRINKEKADTK